MPGHYFDSHDAWRSDNNKMCNEDMNIVQQPAQASFNCQSRVPVLIIRCHPEKTCQSCQLPLPFSSLPYVHITNLHGKVVVVGVSTHAGGALIKVSANWSLQKAPASCGLKVPLKCCLFPIGWNHVAIIDNQNNTYRSIPFVVLLKGTWRYCGWYSLHLSILFSNFYRLYLPWPKLVLQ